jgi:hypothetical protein
MMVRTTVPWRVSAQEVIPAGEILHLDEQDAIAAVREGVAVCFAPPIRNAELLALSGAIRPS